MKDILTIAAASYFIAIPITVMLYLLFALPSDKRNKYIATLLVGGVLSLIIAKISNTLYYDPRPFIEGHFAPLIISSRDSGFPSDHTLLASFIAFATLSVSRRLCSVLLVVALIVGLARMAAGVHHSWDVLGSFLITGVSYVVARYSVNYLIAHRKKQRA